MRVLRFTLARSKGIANSGEISDVGWFRNTGSKEKMCSFSLFVAVTGIDRIRNGRIESRDSQICVAGH